MKKILLIAILIVAFFCPKAEALFIQIDNIDSASITAVALSFDREPYGDNPNIGFDFQIRSTRVGIDYTNIYFPTFDEAHPLLSGQSLNTYLIPELTGVNFKVTDIALGGYNMGSAGSGGFGGPIIPDITGIDFISTSPSVPLSARFIFLSGGERAADTLITPVYGAAYTNPTIALPNSNPNTEEMFLKNILGLVYNDPSINYLGKLFENYEQNSLEEEITFPWLYAVVKSDGPNDGWYAYQSNGDGYLNVGPFDYDISHVSFFGSQKVPEPTTMLLLGLGLIGLAGIRRKLKK